MAVHKGAVSECAHVRLAYWPILGLGLNCKRGSSSLPQSFELRNNRNSALSAKMEAALPVHQYCNETAYTQNAVQLQLDP